MKPLRVLYLIDSLGPGGAQRQLVTLVLSLDRALVAPEVAVYHPMSRFRPELDAAGVRVHVLEGSGGRDPRVLFALRRLLKRERFDIVHSYLRTPGTLARLAAPSSRGTAVVVSERNVDLAHSRARVAVERFLSSRADAMIVNAHAIAREVERLVPSWSGRTHVVPNGVDWAEPTEAERIAGGEFRARHVGDADLLLGVVARVEPQKAPDLLMDALELVPEPDIRRLRIVWVGPRIDDGLADTVDARLAGSSFAGRVEFAGATKDTREVYLGIDGLILCSRWEGLPNVVLEALAHARPVVATDVGDTATLVGDGARGWLVPPDDARSLAGALVEFVRTKPAELAAMGRLGAEFVSQNYSTSRLVEGTLDVYREVLGRDRLSAIDGTGEPPEHK